MMEEWTLERIGDLGQVQAGRQRSPHFVQGKLRPYLRVANVFDGYINTSDVYSMMFTEDEYAEYRLEHGDILLNEGQSLKLVGRPAMYTNHPPDCCFQNTLIRFRANKRIYRYFALQLFRHLMYSGSFARVATQTTSVAHLGVARFANMRVPLPPISQQRRIAEILGAWDEAIAAAERLIAALRERKRGLMQRLLAGEVRVAGSVAAGLGRSDVPQGWRIVRLGQVFARVQRSVGRIAGRVLSITAGVGFVDQQEKFGRVIAGKNLENYILLRRGEFAYNKGNSGSYPQGCIYRLDEFDEGAVPNVYYCFAPRTEGLSSEYYAYYFESGALNGQLRRLINSGVRNDGLLNLSADEFFNLEVLEPPQDEQEKIARILDVANEELRLSMQRLALLRQQKRGLMQQLLTGQLRVTNDMATPPI